MDNLIPIPPKKKKYLIWSGKISTKEEALEIIKSVSNGFYFIATLQIVLGYFFIGIISIIDGAIYAICAFLLRKLNSRIIAIILLLFSITALVMTGINKFDNKEGGGNITLAVIMVWTSVRATQATFKLKKFQ